MPRWTNKPPHGSGHSGLRLIRTPAEKPLKGLIVSTSLVGTATHFVNRRTTPCEPGACDACAAGIPWRWHGYLALRLDPTHELVILELTARAADQLTDYHARYGTLRGAHLIAARVPQRPNGRVVLRTKPADLERTTLPDEPDLPALLLHIWGLDEQTTTVPAAPTKAPWNRVIPQTTETKTRPPYSPDHVHDLPPNAQPDHPADGNGDPHNA